MSSSRFRTPFCPLHRRLRVLLLISLGLWWAATGAVWAQEPAAAPAPYNSGDEWLDRHLADIDRYALRYPEAFLAELERMQACRVHMRAHWRLSRAGGRGISGWPAFWRVTSGKHAGPWCVRAVVVAAQIGTA